MADFQLFVVGAVDYTDKVKQNEYDVHSDDVVDTWVDGNYRTRTSVIRKRVTGSVKLLMKKAEYNQFITDMETARIVSNMYSIGVHPNNVTTGTGLVTIQALCTVSAEVAYGTPSYSFQPAAMFVTVVFEEW